MDECVYFLVVVEKKVLTLSLSWQPTVFLVDENDGQTPRTRINNDDGARGKYYFRFEFANRAKLSFFAKSGNLSRAKKVVKIKLQK